MEISRDGKQGRTVKSMLNSEKLAYTMYVKQVKN